MTTNAPTKEEIEKPDAGDPQQRESAVIAFLRSSPAIDQFLAAEYNNPADVFVHLPKIKKAREKYLKEQLADSERELNKFCEDYQKQFNTVDNVSISFDWDTPQRKLSALRNQIVDYKRKINAARELLGMEKSYPGGKSPFFSNATEKWEYPASSPVTNDDGLSPEAKAEKQLIDGYFDASDIREALQHDKPADFLKNKAVSELHGRTIGDYSFKTERMAISMWLKGANRAKDTPVFVITPGMLAKKVLESEKALKIKENFNQRSAAKLAEAAQPEPEFITDSENREIPIPLDLINPSPFESQTRRRKHFREHKLNELAASVRENGVLQGITVRAVAPFGKFSHYEIVFGERRWIASKRAGLTTVPCKVRDIADDRIIELQLTENTEREDPAPMDEAFSYHYWHKTSGMSIKAIALKCGKNEKTISSKIKLNDLIEELVDELEDEHLPLQHAVEIAKLPKAAQHEIYEYGWAYRNADYNQGAITFDEFKNKLEKNIHLRFSSEKFDRDLPELHPMGLTCTACHERTGFMPMLWDESIKDDERCLNRKCFQNKTNLFIQIQRQAAVTVMEPPAAPMVPAGSVEPPPVEDSFLTAPSPAIPAAPSAAGSPIRVSPEALQAAVQESPNVTQLAAREREFQSKVAGEVRHEIFGRLSRFFNANDARNFKPVMVQLISRLWLESSYSQMRSETLMLTSGWENAPETEDFAQWRKFFLTLDDARLSQLMFLLAYEDEGYVMHSYANPQEIVEELAETYLEKGLYKKIDAEVRLDFAPEKFKNIARTYKFDLDDGRNPEVPHFWIELEK